MGHRGKSSVTDCTSPAALKEGHGQLLISKTSQKRGNDPRTEPFMVPCMQVFMLGKTYNHCEGT